MPLPTQYEGITGAGTTLITGVTRLCTGTVIDRWIAGGRQIRAVSYPVVGLAITRAGIGRGGGSKITGRAQGKWGAGAGFILGTAIPRVGSSRVTGRTLGEWFAAAGTALIAGKYG